MDENFWKFLGSLSPLAKYQPGSYNPAMQVQAGGGNPSAAPWWAATAFAQNRNRVMKASESAKGLPSRGPVKSPFTIQRALDRKLGSFDKSAASSSTNDRERVAAKIAAASKKWKLPGNSPFVGKPNAPALKTKATSGGGGSANYKSDSMRRGDIMSAAVAAQQARLRANIYGKGKASALPQRRM